KPEETVKIVRYPAKEDPIAMVLRLLNADEDEEVESDEDGEDAAHVRQTLIARSRDFVLRQPEEWRIWWNALPPDLREQGAYALQMAVLGRDERILAVMPWTLSSR
ncbi:MAG: hypothetical protein ACKOAX_11070, partial [Candidatus Kapaibacterium sp.]